MSAATGVTAAGGAVNVEWLALRNEPILDPGIEIVDAHHHLWDMPGHRYLFDDLLADVRSGHNVRATIYAQGQSMYRTTGPEELRPVGETEFAARIAAQSESGASGPARLCAAIIGFVDFALGARAEPVLEAHIRAGGGRLRGIRGFTTWDADGEVHKLSTPRGVLMERRTREVVGCIERLGLSLDVWVFHRQLPEVIDLCRTFPHLPVIIDHIGGPLGIGAYRGHRDEVFAAWRRDMRVLATLPNTFVKIGGMAMRISGLDYHLQAMPPSSDELHAAWRPYIEECIQSFGPSRCMFESNFPVDKTMCSYPVLWNAFKKSCIGYSDMDKRSMLGGTAKQVYFIRL